MTALDQSLADLLDKHDLLSISITAHRNDAGDHTHINASVQWRDESQEHRRGCSQVSDKTAAKALSAAIGGMLALRAPVVSLPDEPVLVEA